MIKLILGRLPRRPSSPTGDISSGGPATANTGMGNDSVAMASEDDSLPRFRDAPSLVKPGLFLRMLGMCSVVYDFSEPWKNLREKEIKRKILLDLVDYVSTVSTKFKEQAVEEATRMAAANMFRTFPSSTGGAGARDVVYFAEHDEKLPALEPSWPHLELVYEFFVRFLVSSGTITRIAKRYVDRSFILRLLDLFDSEDPREREYLKIILHRTYGKFMVYRPFIRNAINNIFYQFIYETEKHNGIAELLLVLGSIIGGFVLPLMEKHKSLLTRALIPLHKPKSVALYHQQLSYCIMLFLEKDNKLAGTVIMGLLKYWPLTNTVKEVIFLGELEEVVEATPQPELLSCIVPLSRQVALCLSSSHFQVAQRALFLWKNDKIINLIIQNRKIILPIIFPALEMNTLGHWNQAVQILTLHVRNLFLDVDQALFNKCSHSFLENKVKESEKQAKHESMWKRLEEVAASNSTNVAASTSISQEAAECQDSSGGDYFNTTMNPSSHQLRLGPTKYIQWKPPPAGWVKINFDGAIKEGFGAGAGALIRDWRGRMLHALAVALTTSSLPSSELRAAWEGLRLASSLVGYDGVWVEGDSLTVISWVQKALQGETKEIPGLLDVLHWITSFRDCRCTHIYHEGNKPADFLAWLGVATSVFFDSEEEIPSQLLDMVRKDREGWMYTRL